MDELFQELSRAANALQKGADPSAVDQRIREQTNGQFQSFEELASALQGAAAGSTAQPPRRQPQEPSEPTAREAEALARQGQRGGTGVTDFVRLLGHGATLGASDELSTLGAGTRFRQPPAPEGQPFSPMPASAFGLEQVEDPSRPSREETLGQQRQYIEDLRTLNPGAAMASEVAGGVALPAAGGAGLAGAITRSNLPVVGGSRLAGGILGGAAGGAGGAATAGFLEGEGGIRERAEGAIVPGIFGSILGGGIGAAGVTLGRMAEAGAAGLSDEASPLLTEAAAKRAQNEIIRSLRIAGVNPYDVQRAVQSIGDDAVVADLGVNAAARARTSTNVVPDLRAPGGPVSALFSRNQGRGERIASSLREASGIDEMFEVSMRMSREAREAAREQYYKPLEQAFERGTLQVPDELAEDPRIQRLLQERVPGQDEAEEGVGFLDLQRLYWRLGDEAEAAANDRQFTLSREFSDLQDEVDEALSNQIGETWDKAQNAWRIASKRVEAHEMGANALYKAPRVIRAELEELPEEAREAYRLGLLDRAETDLRRSPTGSGLSTKFMGAQSGAQTIKEQLEILAEDDQAMRNLLDDLANEERYKLTWGEISGNSTTARQLGGMAAALQDLAVSKAWLARRLLATLAGLGENEMRAAERAIGEALLTQGEEAAKLIARDLSLLSQISGGAGAAAGTAAGQQGVAQ